MKLKPPEIQRHLRLVREGDAVHVLMSVAYVSSDADGSDLVIEWGRSPALDELIDQAKEQLTVMDRRARARRRKMMRVVKPE